MISVRLYRAVLPFVLLASQAWAQTEALHFETALENGLQAQKALKAVHQFLTQQAHPTASPALMSANDQNHWTVAETAAQFYPTLVLSAYLTDRNRFDSSLKNTLRDERQYTGRLHSLPDDFDLKTQTFLFPQLELPRILAGASAYAARGLIPITQVVGPDLWQDRLQELADDLLLSVRSQQSDAIPPSEYAEINGQFLTLLVWLTLWTGNEHYLEYARSIGDVYCLNILPRNGGLPAQRWNFATDKARVSRLVLDQTGVSILEGLILLYTVETLKASDRALIYRPTLARMFDVLYSHGVDPSGFFYRAIEPDGRGGYTTDRKNRSPHWAKLAHLSALFGKLTGNSSYSAPVRSLLKSLPSQLIASRTRRNGKIPIRMAELQNLVHFSFDLLTDPTQKTDLLIALDRLVPVPKNRAEPPPLERIQEWLSYAWHKTGGLRLHPWHPDLQFGVSLQADTLFVALQSKISWQGEILFDRIALPADHLPDLQPFYGGFPKAFPIVSDDFYTLQVIGAGSTSTWQGTLLQSGLNVKLTPETTYRIKIFKNKKIGLAVQPPVPGQEETLIQMENPNDPQGTPDAR
ncbi:MAG: hypothetical protein O7G87_08320 [bacterium]|nr:hypothetical protein [bacterium]